MRKLHERPCAMCTEALNWSDSHSARAGAHFMGGWNGTRKSLPAGARIISIIGFLPCRNNFGTAQRSLQKSRDIRLWSSETSQQLLYPARSSCSCIRVDGEYPAQLRNTVRRKEHARRAAYDEDVTTVGDLFGRSPVHREHRPAAADSARGPGRTKRRRILRL